MRSSTTALFGRTLPCSILRAQLCRSKEKLSLPSGTGRVDKMEWPFAPDCYLGSDEEVADFLCLKGRRNPLKQPCKDLVIASYKVRLPITPRLHNQVYAPTHDLSAICMHAFSYIHYQKMVPLEILHLLPGMDTWQ